MVPHTSSGRGVAIAFLLAALLLAPRPAWGAWSADPVQVHATTAECPQVAACGDGALGAIVVWQENSSGAAGALFARHLLGGGDVDLAWPAPASVCATVAERGALGAVTDQAGGAYVWWLAGSALSLTRIDATGALAPGWPAAGRLLGSQVNADARPTVLADGGGGVYVAWLQPALQPDLQVVAQMRVTHLGPGNTGVDGCPPGGRAIGLTNERTEYVNTATIALAPGGGVWAALGTTVIEPESWLLPGEWRLARLLSSLQAAPGWTSRGVAIGECRGDLLDGYGVEPVVPAMTLVGVAPDGAGGAWIVRGTPAGTPGGTPLLFRYAADGTPAPAWPAQGQYVNGQAGDIYPGFTPSELSFRAFADKNGGVWAGRPNLYDHGASYSLHHFAENGATSLATVLGSDWRRLEIAADGEGGFYFANCVPTGPYGMYDPYASVGVHGGAGGASWSEYHPDILVHWYGDQGLAATGDGGAILVWSQARERFGLYAVRLGVAGQVTGVTPAAAQAARLALRFAPHTGVRARATFAAAGTARLSLFDVSGRLVAAERLEVRAGSHEWTVPGTRDLPAGLYFASVSGPGSSSTARVVVTR